MFISYKKVFYVFQELIEIVFFFFYFEMLLGPFDVYLIMLNA